MTEGMTRVATATGFRLGATGWGILGGLEGEIEGCVVQVEVSLKTGLPRLNVRHPALPAFELDKRAARQGEGWVNQLDSDARETLDRWVKVPGFRSFHNSLVLELGPKFDTVPERASAMAHLMSEIARTSAT